MKIRPILFSLLAVSGIASANPTDTFAQTYLGVQGGLANTNFNISMVQSTTGVPITSASVKNHIVAYRVYTGYSWNQYFSAELGYLRPRSTRFTQINNGTISNGDISEYAIDLSGKFFIPMAAYIHLSPYLKLGAAYVSAHSQGGITRNAASDWGYTLHPVIGAGIGYSLGPNLIVDLSYTSYTRRNSSVPRIDLLFLGLTYHFGFDDETAGSHNYGDVNNNDP